MKAVLIYLVLLISLYSLSSIHSQDIENSGIGVEIASTVLSRYVWRGYDLSHKDPVWMSYVNYKPSQVPGLTLSGGIILGLINDRSMRDYQRNLDEWDLSTSYEREFIPEKLVCIVALQYYRYTSRWTKGYYEDNKDLEASIEAWYNVTDYFSPLIRYFRGLDNKIKGNYFEMGFYSDFELVENHLSLNPTAYAGYSMQYEFQSDPALSNIVLEIPLVLSYNKVNLGASFNFTRPMKKVMNGSTKKTFTSLG